MKSALFLIAVLLFTACTSEPKPAFAGIDKNDTKEMKSLKISLFQYTEATISNDTEALLSFIYPPVFTIIPKEKMRQMLIKTFHSRDVPKIKDVKHSKIESIKKYDAGVYSIITSSMTTIIKSPKPKNQEFEEKMLTALQKQIGSRGTISLDKEKHLFNIRHTNKTIALNEKGSWKFIGFKQAQKYIKKGIFPLMLIDKLN